MSDQTRQTAIAMMTLALANGDTTSTEEGIAAALSSVFEEQGDPLRGFEYLTRVIVDQALLMAGFLEFLQAQFNVDPQVVLQNLAMPSGVD